MIFNPEKEKYYLEVKRGTSQCVEDQWGPWCGDLEGESMVLEQMEKWHATLDAAGWITLPYRDPEGEIGTHEANRPNMVRSLAKLPRCELIPSTLLDMLDSDRASNGNAVAAGVLRAAGQDFHVDFLGRLWDGAPCERIWLTIQEPGNSKRTEGGKRLSLDLPQVDALLDFLIDVRKGMAPKETANGILNPAVGSLAGETPLERMASLRRHARFIEAILAELSKSTPERLGTILAIARMINSGEMTVDLVYGPDDEVEYTIN
jgi:hypothetical protein